MRCVRRRRPLRRLLGRGAEYDGTKRALDIVVTLLAIVLSAPLWLAISAWIKLDSEGPILHKASRLGRGGLTFTKLKFRTMRPHGEKLLEELLAQDGAVREEYRRTYKIRNDPRITRAGRLLRRFSLDELP